MIGSEQYGKQKRIRRTAGRSLSDLLAVHF